MRLDEFAIRPRPRTSWESLDLGVLLMQGAWLQTWRSSLLFWLPIAALSAAVLVSTNLFWALVVIWFLRPLMGRTTLLILSRRVFSVRLSAQEVTRHLPSVLGRQWASTYLVRRWFGIRRTFVEPIVSLEGLSGQALSQRRSLLLDGGTQNALWRMALSISLIELCLFASVMVLVAAFAPEDMEWLLGDDLPFFLQAWILLSYWLVVAWSEPLWASSGFALYLMRRSELEGWDIEVAFKSLAQRVREAGLGAKNVSSRWLPLLWAGVLGLGSLHGAPPCFAQPTHAVEQDSQASVVGEDPQTPVERVYARAELKTTAERWVQDRKNGRADKSVSGWGELFSILGWLGVAGVILALLVALTRWAMGREAQEPVARQPVQPAVQEVLGLDLREEALPKDVVAAAQARWHGGDARGALALLYRACLVHLREAHGIEFERGDTERICQAKERTLGDRERSRAFAQLTQFWQRVAYGSQPIAEAEFQLGLQTVRVHFQRGGRA